MTPPPPLRPGGAFLLVLIHLAGVMTVGVLAYNMANERSIPLFSAAAVLVGPLIALYVGLNRYTPHLTSRQALGLERPRGRKELARLGGAIVAGAALAPLAVEITVRILRAWPLDDRTESIIEPPDTGVWIVVAVVEVVLSPLTQEALFRGLILRRLRASVGQGRALFVATVLYVAAIVDPHVMPVALLLAVVTGVFALRSRSLWVPIAAHITASVLEIVVIGPDGWPDAESPGPAPQPLWLLITCAVVLVTALVAVWRAEEPA